MQRKCICIKNWRDYEVGDKATLMIGGKGTWFLGGATISPLEFHEHFEGIEE